MKFRFFLFLLLAALSTGIAFPGSLYTIDDSTNSLYVVDQTTGTVSLVGYTGIASGDFGDLTYNPIDGKLYWIPGRGNDSLFTIDPSTGQATLVGSHGIDDLFALAWDTSSDTLYAQSTSGNFYSLNSATGAPTLIGSNSIYPGGLVYNPLLDSLLLLQAGNDQLYAVSRSDGSVSQVAGGAHFVNDNGIAFDSAGNTYWVSSYSAGLIQYDSTFNQLAVFPQSGNFDGIAFANSTPLTAGPSVPEPASFLLIGSGLVTAALLRRRRRK